MPCGGIIVCTDGPGTIADTLKNGQGCWVCDKGGCCHFLIEWDAYIHARCAVKALADPESDVAVIIGHRHEVFLDFSLEPDARALPTKRVGCSQ
jgi:hypothetical protein